MALVASSPAKPTAQTSKLPGVAGRCRPQTFSRYRHAGLPNHRPSRGLTESLTHLGPTEWQTIIARLRRARLLAGGDPHNPGQLDTHPLVREYFGEQLSIQRPEAWK